MQDNNSFNSSYIPPDGYNNQNSSQQNFQNGYSGQYGSYRNNGYYVPPQDNRMQNQQYYVPQQNYNNMQNQYYTQQYANPQYQQAYYKPVDFYDTDPAERKKIRKLYNGVGLALIFQFLLMLILVTSMQAILHTVGYGGEYKEDGVTWIIHFWEEIECAWMPAIASIIMFFIYNAITRYKSKELFSTQSITPKFIITAVILTLFFQQISILLMNGLSTALYNIGYEVLFNYEVSTDVPTRLADYFATIILAPIAEEMFFRGIVLRNIAKVSQRYAIFFSALIFGLMHGNPYQMILGFLIGIVLGYVTVKTGSIIPSIICHMANNIVASIPDMFSLVDEKLSDPIGIALMVLFLLAGLAVFLIVLSMGKIKIPEYTIYHKHRTTPIILTSVAVYIAIGIYIIEILANITPVAASS
jgi:membrane protease YdiL (CAAX protease family)